MNENKQFFIGAGGTKVEVTEEIYLAYYRSKRRDRYYERDIKTERAVCDTDGNVTGYKPSKEDSLDRLMETGEDYAAEAESVEETVIRGIMSGALHQALDKLPEADRALIDALFFSNGGTGMSEREYSEVSGMPRKTIAYRRNRALERLKKFFEKS
jgi:RNA polymerase sigma factor (sigma-70 family)